MDFECLKNLIRQNLDTQSKSCGLNRFHVKHVKWVTLYNVSLNHTDKQFENSVGKKVLMYN